MRYIQKQDMFELIAYALFPTKKKTLLYLDVTNQHCDKKKSTCKNNDVENNLQPFCCALQVPKCADNTHTHTHQKRGD